MHPPKRADIGAFGLANAKQVFICYPPRGDRAVQAVHQNGVGFECAHCRAQGARKRKHHGFLPGRIDLGKMGKNELVRITTKYTFGHRTRIWHQPTQRRLDVSHRLVIGK